MLLIFESDFLHIKLQFETLRLDTNKNLQKTGFRSKPVALRIKIPDFKDANLRSNHIRYTIIPLFSDFSTPATKRRMVPEKSMNNMS